MDLEEILEVNKKQKEFYNTKQKNFATKIWSKIRHGLLANIRKEIGISNQIYALHKEWIGEVKDKKVLDLGCFSGNHLSVYLAENAKEYIGLDLSDVGIKNLNQKILHLKNAKGVVADFLSDSDFPDSDFDIIYAYGVLHHFQNVDIIINKLNQKLASGGVVISYDPLETNFSVKLFRTIYRPFQSDKDWEWPFTKKTFYKFKENFYIQSMYGVLGKTKWFFLINIIPMSKERKMKLGKKWHNQDWVKSSESERYMFNCMHLTMKMIKKECSHH